MAGLHAVVVGIDYTILPTMMRVDVRRRAGAEPLAAAEADAKAMAAFLTGRGYNVIALLGSAATGAQIMAALEQKHHAAGLFGTLILYFAGLGDVDSYHQDAAFLLPVDADPAKLSQTALALGDLARSYLTGGPAILICDCCPSLYAQETAGPERWGTLGVAFEERAAQVAALFPQVLALVSCAADRPAREYSFVRRGIFTHYLLAYWGAAHDSPDVQVLQTFRDAPPVAVPPISFRLDSPAISVTFAPDGRTLATGHNDGAIRLWAMEDGVLRKTMKYHAGAVHGLAYAPDGSILASAGGDGRIGLWGPGAGHLLPDLEGYRFQLFGTRGAVNRLAFTPDGKVLVSGGGKRIRLWDVARRQPVLHPQFGDALTFSVHGAINALAVSPDSRFLAAGGNGGLIEVLQTRHWSKYATVMDPTTSVLSLAFGPYGEILASGSDALRLWRVDDLGLDATLPGYAGQVTSVAFAPGGRLLAAGTADAVICLWRVDDRQLLAYFEGHSAAVSCVRFSPDGRMLASASADGTIRFWPLV